MALIECPDEGCAKVQVMQSEILHLKAELAEIKQALKDLVNGQSARSTATIATLIGIVVTAAGTIVTLLVVLAK